MNHLRKSWRFATLVRLLGSATSTLGPLLEVLVRRGRLPSCRLDPFEPTPELTEAWEFNCLTWDEIVRLRPSLAEEVRLLEAVFQADEQHRRAGVAAAAPGAPACDQCGGGLTGDRVTCPPCLRHKRLSKAHAATRRQLDAAAFNLGASQRNPEPAASSRVPSPSPTAVPLPPLALNLSALRSEDRVALGVDVPSSTMSCLEPAPRGYRIGSYAEACDNCGETQLLVNGGLCRACDDYQRKYGASRPEHRHGTTVGECVMCHEHKRLVSRRRPCNECYQDERSRYDATVAKRCVGCGQGEKAIATTGWTLAFDCRGGVVSHLFHWNLNADSSFATLATASPEFNNYNPSS